MSVSLEVVVHILHPCVNLFVCEVPLVIYLQLSVMPSSNRQRKRVTHSLTATGFPHELWVMMAGRGWMSEPVIWHKSDASLFMCTTMRHIDKNESRLTIFDNLTHLSTALWSFFLCRFISISPLVCLQVERVPAVCRGHVAGHLPHVHLP